jgi:hypothetical protein
MKPRFTLKKKAPSSPAAERFVSMMMLIFFEMQACYTLWIGGVPIQGRSGTILFAIGPMAWIVAAIFYTGAVFSFLIFLRSVYIGRWAFRFSLCCLLMIPVACGILRPVMTN